ncbi:MAG: OmpA family protein [Methyloglobulus sp.]|nr:OmpA family protein [Methyloglobulus sp.]
MIKILLPTLAAVTLTACCNTGTTVVLIPDAAGKVGQVSVTTKAGTTNLSKANESTAATKAEQSPTSAAIMSTDKIQTMFGDTLAKVPIPPERFRLYFSSGTSDISAETRAEIGKVIDVIKKHESCDLSVIGHSDRVGDNASNKGLSIDRAKAVAEILTSNGIDAKCMDIRYYGENDPAIPTADNVAEARNRRVEVEIR